MIRFLSAVLSGPVSGPKSRARGERLPTQFAGESSVGAFLLDKHTIHTGADVRRLDDGSIEVITRPQQWGHSLSFPIQSFQKAAHGQGILVRVELAVQVGKIGVSCWNERRRQFAAKEVMVPSSGSGASIELFAEDLDEDTELLVRNVATNDRPSTAVLRAIQNIPASNSSLTEGQRRQFATRNFSYWHYEHDLGYGVKTEPNRPEIVKWHALRERIIFGVIDKYFGASLAGKSCLDFGCCSGWWSFRLADRGAAPIVAIDKNPEHIEQAKLVQSCSDSPGAKEIAFLHDDILTYGAAPNAFDIVLCLGLMYHLTDLVGAAARVYRASRHLAIVDSAVSDLSGSILELADWNKYSCCFEHEFSFIPTRDSLVQILRHVGFRKVVPWTPIDAETEAAYGPGKSRVLIVVEK